MKMLFVLLLVFSIPAAQCAPVDDASSPLQAVTDGKLLLNLRPRYEYVDQDGRAHNANALTLRSLVGWQTQSYAGLSAMIQLINVGRVNDNYNDTKNGRTTFPIVADPDDTDINQLYFDYSGVPDTKLRLGKQSIKLDNVRFIGNVEFRQVMQVFTGVTAENKSLPDTTFYAGHLERLKTIFGDEQGIKLDILHGDYEWSKGNHAIAYGYFHDSAKTASVTGFADNSNRILGLRGDGAWPLNDEWKLLYTAEYAKQDSYSDGDSRIDADYLHLGIGAGSKLIYARLDREVLGSNGGAYAFQTPLGTNHLFQGWADMFLTTPASGIRDTFITVGGEVAAVKWTSELHDFRSDVGSVHFGKELDFGVSYPLGKGLSGKIELAHFTESDVLTPVGSRKRDTDKVWLTFLYNYE
jgi:hypothetical protein